jgi:hypothetical protein
MKSKKITMSYVLKRTRKFGLPLMTVVLILFMGMYVANARIKVVSNGNVGVGNQFTGTAQTIISNYTYVSNTTINACSVILNNVKVQNGAKLTIDADETTLNAGCEVELGSQLEIK